MLKEATDDIDTNEIQMDDSEPPKTGPGENQEDILTGVWNPFPSSLPSEPLYFKLLYIRFHITVEEKFLQKGKKMFENHCSQSPEVAVSAQSCQFKYCSSF